MKKRYCCFALAVFMLAGSVIPVQAEDYTGRDGWQAEFTGEKIESNFTSKAFADEIKILQPGDSVEIQVAVKNSSGQGNDWYMSNEVLESLEDSSPANGGAYTYVLTWRGKGAEKTLYNSESVGGENVTAAGEGLHEATNGLEQFFYLDRLEKGETGNIILKVALNGETQGNNYQNTLARLQLNFAVEGTGNGSGPENGGGGNGARPYATSTIYTLGSVQTGDTNRLFFWSAVTFIGGLAVMICAVIYQKKNRGGDSGE